MSTSVATTIALSVSSPKDGRAIDEDVVEVLSLAFQEFRHRRVKSVLAAHRGDEFDVGAGEIDRGGHAPQRGQVGTTLGDGRDRRVVEQHLIDRGCAGSVFNAERRGRIALRVGVDHQHIGSLARERSGEVD